MALIFLQQHNLKRAFSGMGPTNQNNVNLLTNSKKNCKYFYVNLFKDNACLRLQFKFVLHFFKWKDNLKYFCYLCI